MYADSFQLAESDATKPWRSLTFYGAQTSSLTLTYDRAIPPRTARSHASETDGRTARPSGDAYTAASRIEYTV